ncbi:hypothetical protein [Sulfitobacter sp. MF3-043]|uniref:hypothetical protein n=1 Tax=Sulfitobacter sediminivivens TaxID=3252902 RepID=UPI0036DC2D20
MPRLLIFALMSVGLLSACAGKLGGPPPAPVFGGKYSQSVGFTGVGSHTQAVEVLSKPLFSKRTAPVVVVRSGVRVPQISVRGGSSNRSTQASRAIRSGGTLDSNSVAVNVAGRDVRLSIVRVGSNPFAVFRAPRGTVITMGPTTVSNFLAEVPALTGCTPDGGGYSIGPSRARATGIAGAINCP